MASFAVTLHKVLHVLTLVLCISGGAHGLDTTSLQKILSSGSYIGNSSTAPRWSEYKAPQPGAVVHPATEADVQKTVKWAVERNIPFLAQNGGIGWATTFRLNEDGIIIDLDQLRGVSFNSDKTLVTVGGGALISDVTAAGSSAGSLVTTGTCDCVGTLGAILGGGIGYLTGKYGLGVDNVKSLNVVLADGTLQTVSATTSPDLYFALRGAAPNFGIVTSAVLLAHPVTASNPSTAWGGALIFTPAQLDSVLNTISNLTLTADSALTMTWVLSNGSPTIIVSVFYHGTEAAGRSAFSPLLALVPVADTTKVTPYTSWNAGSATACIKGGRKPTFGVGLAKLDPATWHAVYDSWYDLVQQPAATTSSVLLNVYPMAKARTLPVSSSAYPFRDTVSLFASTTVSYTDQSFDATALSYGKKVRSLWQKTDGLAQDSTYINNGFGDESLQTIYGVNLSKLQALKKQYDPKCRFDQWFPLL